ncbi:hypothetical protein L7F22_039543 [Adiantum nelumboides]|nr:hypothetical protein [Adiantum nelumboides]
MDASQASARPHWRLSEVFVLCEARKAVDIRQEDGDISLRAHDRWQWVMEKCKTSGIHHSKKQCRSKYERVHRLYVRIRDYERRIPSGCNSYWQMDNAEHCQKGLPTEDFAMVLYEKMESLFGDKRKVDVGFLLNDSFDDDTLPIGEKLYIFNSIVEYILLYTVRN